MQKARLEVRNNDISVKLLCESTLKKNFSSSVKSISLRIYTIEVHLFDLIRRFVLTELNNLFPVVIKMVKVKIKFCTTRDIQILQ